MPHTTRTKQQEFFPDLLLPVAEDNPRGALDELVDRSLAYRTGPELKELLEFTRRFPQFAPFNAMLLHVQNRGIVYALRAPRWEKEYGRRVRPAARSYVILQPMGPVAFVFDLSDTEPIDPEKDRVPALALNPFPVKGKPPTGMLEKLLRACASIHIQIEYKDLATNVAGIATRSPKPTEVFHIALNLKHSQAQQIGTLSHELAHIFCGHLGVTEDAFWLPRKSLSLPTREFEAEAVAYLVTERLALDIGSAEYLSGYLGADQATPDYSLDAVLKAAGKIEEMLYGRFRSSKHKRGATAKQ